MTKQSWRALNLIIIKMNASKNSFNSGGVTGKRKKLTAMVSVCVYWVCVWGGGGRVFFPRLKQQLPLPPSPLLCVCLYIYIWLLLLLLYINTIICVCMVWVTAAKSSPETRGRSPGLSRLPVFYITHTHHPIYIPFSSAQPDTHDMCACVYATAVCLIISRITRAPAFPLFYMPPHLLPFCHTARDIRRRCYLVLTEQI